MSIFEADPEGFRVQNADRPPEHLVRELIQNALDEDGITRLSVDVVYHGKRKGTTVIVTDNTPTGVRDPRLLFTIWMSDKQDSPTKRGRMGRGLKELISVSDETTIRSVSCDALVFTRARGGKWERKEKARLGRLERGTQVKSFVRSWGEKAAKAIVKFCKRIRVPVSVAFEVSYLDDSSTTTSETVYPFRATEVYKLTLPTVLFEIENGERAERERYRECAVECFVPPPGEKPQVYEMGIPVEACEGPVSIDVAQRVILRERRDTLTETYKRQLFAKVLSARVDGGLVRDEELRDNAAIIAAASAHNLSLQTAKKLVDVWTGGKPYAADPRTRAIATGNHVEVVNLRSLPESIREIVRYNGVDVRTVLEQRKEEFCPQIPVLKLNPDQLKTATFFDWIARGIGRECGIKICNGNPGCNASFERGSRTFTIYAEVVGKAFFQKPADPEALRVLIHELSHWTPKDDEHGSEFAHDNDRVGGEVAAFLLANAEQARTLLEDRS